MPKLVALIVVAVAAATLIPSSMSARSLHMRAQGTVTVTPLGKDQRKSLNVYRLTYK